MLGCLHEFFFYLFSLHLLLLGNLGLVEGGGVGVEIVGGLPILELVERVVARVLVQTLQLFPSNLGSY